MKCLLRLLPVLILLSAAPALAHETQGICEPMNPQAQAEFEYARMMFNLDCGSLNACVEQQRLLLNQRTFAEYHRPMPGIRTAPTAYPSANPPRPR